MACFWPTLGLFFSLFFGPILACFWPDFDLFFSPNFTPSSYLRPRFYGFGGIRGEGFFSPFWPVLRLILANCRPFFPLSNLLFWDHPGFRANCRPFRPVFPFYSTKRSRFFFSIYPNSHILSQLCLEEGRPKVVFFLLFNSNSALSNLCHFK